MSSSTEQNRRRFASSPFTWRSQSAPNRDKWYRRGPLSRQRSRQESSGGESSQLLDHMVSRRLVSAIAAWHDLHVSLLQLSMSRAELNNIERKLTIRRRDGSDDSSSPSLVGSRRPSQRGRVEQRRISAKIRKVPSIRPNLLCPKTQIEQVCHHQTTISSPSSSSSTSLSYLCSTTTNDSQNKKLEEEEKINERFNDDEEIKNSTKNRSNSFGQIQKGKSKEHLLIHQDTENNELPTTSSPPTWTATFAQSLQIRSSSTRRRIRSPRPPAKHILILKHSVQLLEPKTQGIECISSTNTSNQSTNFKENKQIPETTNSLKRRGKRRCFSVAKLDENRKQSNCQKITNTRRRQFSYQSEDTDNEKIINNEYSNNDELLTSCSSGIISENELDVNLNLNKKIKILLF
uniref:Uncharacterized protein n=2 Tax=Meloidogyne floridensis TaxID=298350 RepID=A0A915NHZ7_9BILA